MLTISKIGPEICLSKTRSSRQYIGDTGERANAGLQITTQRNPRTTMGSICGTQKRNRCERQETYQHPTERETVETHRRRLVICIGQDELCIRRYPEPPGTRTEDRHRTAYQRINYTSPQRPLDLVVLRTVSVATNVTVFIPFDWSPATYRLASQSPWVQMVVDRHRFIRRIRQTEIDLFTIQYRDRMRERFCD